jgi:hypothetical protein
LTGWARSLIWRAPLVAAAGVTGSVLAVHGAQVQHSGLRAQGVAIVPTTLLRLALGDEQLLSEVAVELYATTARMRLRPASSAWRRFSLGSRGHSSGD